MASVNPRSWHDGDAVLHVGDCLDVLPTLDAASVDSVVCDPPYGDVLHPTVKPLDLVRWLVRLVTPPGGLVLDPFAGSGTTLEACIVEGFRCVAVEREESYVPLVAARMARPAQATLL